jgi:Fe-S oxidoreductase
VAALTFWYGCNVVRHADIIHAAIALLEAVGVEVRPAGGPAYCCGTTEDANLRSAEGMATRTVEKFNALGNDVVTWCPSCHRHMGDFVEHYTQPQFEVSHITEVLYAHRERLAAKLVHAVPRTVMLHRHVGFREVEVNRLVAELLRLVPGLTVLESTVEVPAHMCSELARLPAVLSDVMARTVAEARAAGAEDLVTVFHSCQRLWCGLSAEAPLGVVNYANLLARALGVERPDEYTQWKLAASDEEALAMIGAQRIERVDAEFFRSEVLPEIRRRPPRRGQ